MIVGADADRSRGRDGMNQPDRAARRQRPRAEHRRRPGDPDQAEQVPHRSRRTRPGTEYQQDGDIVESPREIRHHLKRWSIRPLRVVDEEHDGPLLGEPGAQPVDAVGDRGGPLRRCHRLAGQEFGCRVCSSVKRMGIPALGERGRRLLEQRAHDAEEKRGFEAAGRSAAHGEVGPGGASRCMIKQGGLAQPGVRLEHDRLSAAAPDAVDRVVDHPEFVVALDEATRPPCEIRAQMSDGAHVPSRTRTPLGSFPGPSGAQRLPHRQCRSASCAGAR